MGPEFQELGSKRQDKWPEAIKLKQTVLPTVRDRNLKDRHGAMPGRSYVPARKRKLTNRRDSLYFTVLKKSIKVNRNLGDIGFLTYGQLVAGALRRSRSCSSGHVRWPVNRVSVVQRDTSEQEGKPRVKPPAIRLLLEIFGTGRGQTSKTNEPQCKLFL